MVGWASPRPEAYKAQAPHDHPWWVLPSLLLFVYLAQCSWFIRTQSLTYDEPVHIAEGLDAWRHGRFEQYNDHPPLSRLLCTLPVIDDMWQVEVQQLNEGFHVPRISPDPIELAERTRHVNTILGFVLGLLIWMASAELFSRTAANLALVLFAFSPALIAHFSLVTSDGAATLLIFATAWQLIRWRRSTKWPETILLGVVLGLLLLSKFSTAPMFVMALAWILILKSKWMEWNPLRWNWGKTIVAFLLAFFVVWAGYFFHISHLSIHDGTLTASFPHWNEEIVKPVRTTMNLDLPVPAGEYIEGFREVARHNRHGQPAYFLGNVSSTGGWKLYYPIAILLKWPTIVLILAITGFLLAAARRVKVSTDLWIMASFPTVYFFLAVLAHFNIGERHVLPLYPFALLFAVAVWQKISHHRWATLFAIMVLTLNVADVLRFAPDYLSYFSVVTRPYESYRLLSDSNLDWGQGLLSVRDYEQANPGKQTWLAYFGSVNPGLYGIRARLLAENERGSGDFIVSATDLSGQFLRDPSAYHWLLQYPHVATLNHSMYVFRVDGKAPK
ncbi:MAG TPA: glycosyltransferase family 39 protein [Terriglobales bacterium]|jgi:hypothetical protein